MRTRPLNLIQDVQTRWNSTLKMMRRARQLKKVISEYYAQYPKELPDALSKEEWTHIDYLIEIMYPFQKFTNLMGMVESGVTIHFVFDVYNQLFDHIEKQLRKLRPKKIKWKIEMKRALEKGKDKLSEYYARTANEIGHVYGIATILNPDNKLSLFKTKDWEGECEETGESWVCAQSLQRKLD
jgi:hypothetical protein